MSKFLVGMEGSALKFGLDLDQDGQASIGGKLHLSEGIQELMQKGGAIEGAKVVEFKFEGTKAIVKLDTDRDGEPLLELELDLMESFDEVSGLVAKK